MLKFFRKPYPTVPSSSTLELGKSMTSQIEPFTGTPKIFGVPVKGSIWDVIDLPSSSVEDDGTVGYGFLKNFNIVIDFERRYVWLENFTGKVADEPKAEPGIRIAQKSSGGYVGYHVYK